MLTLGTGVDPLWALQIYQPYDRISIDAHRVDCLGIVEIETPSGPVGVLVKRIWIVAVFDNFSRAALGYAISFDEEVSAQVVENALKMSLSPWKPRPLSTRVPAYSVNGGFPSGLFPLLVGAFGVLVSLDNALVHLSNQIAEKARRRLGCTLTWGPCGVWYHNDTLERFFGSLTRLGFQRLPSSTGSNPSDPARQNPEESALKHRIAIKEIVDLADVLLTRQNSLPHSALAGRSPLQVIDDFLASPNGVLFARPLPATTGDILDLGESMVTAKVCGNIKKGRRPYVQVAGARYTSPALAESFLLIGERLNIHFRDDGDFREIDAYHISGQYYGKLRAQGQWALTPHTLWIRRQVLKKIGKVGGISQSDPDPVNTFYRNINNEAVTDAERNPLKISAAATKLNRIEHELDDAVPAGSSEPIPNYLTVETHAPTVLVEPRKLSLSAALSSAIRRPKWKTNG